MTGVNPAVSAEIVEGFDTLDGLAEAWNELFVSRFHEPSTSFEWTRAMASHHVRVDDRCFLVCLRNGNTLLGIVPLVARKLRVFGGDVVLLAPLSEEYNTHSDLLLGQPSGEVISAFVAALFRFPLSWDCFRMARLLETSPLAALLEQCFDHQNRSHHVRDGLPAYELRLPASFDSYLHDRSAKFRNHLKRTERKLRSRGAVTVNQLTTPQHFEAAYEAVLTVERASWKHRHGTGIGAVPHQIGFYRDFARAALATSRLHLQWLTVADHPVAYNLGFIHGGRYHYLKTSYDVAFRRLSPSTYLRARLIEDLIERGVTHFDFPGEPYEWESQWTDSVRWRKVVTMYGPTLKGRLLALADRIRHRQRPERTLQHINPFANAPHSENSR